MAQAKIIYILITKVNKLFSFFSSWCFLKEIENVFSVFLSSYRKTRESLGELEHFSFSQISRNTVYVFYFLNMALGDGRYNARSDWLTARSERSFYVAVMPTGWMRITGMQIRKSLGAKCPETTTLTLKIQAH